MPRPATGQLRRTAAGWEVRVTVARGRREIVPLAFSPDEESAARERCKILADLAVRLRRANQTAHAAQILATAARARTPQQSSAVEEAVVALEKGKVKRKEIEDITLNDHAKNWTSGTYAKRFPDHVRTKVTSDDDARRFRDYIEPHIGHLPVAVLTLDHADAVMSALPTTLASASRRQVAQTLSRLLGMAVYPCRLRSDNPVPKGWLPKVKGGRAYDFLRPSEDAILLAHEGTPLVRRLLYGFLHREGCRASEALALRWGDLDLEHGSISLDKNKTSDPRMWAMRADTLRALKLWKARPELTPEADDHVFAEQSVPLTSYASALATKLRLDLRAAGVTRSSLFERTTSRAPMRAHDLRAGFVTLNLALGRNEAWIADRTGHRSSQMINRYRRAARSWAEMNLGDLPPLDVALPELKRQRKGQKQLRCVDSNHDRRIQSPQSCL